MSIVRRHSLLGVRLLTPVLVQTKSANYSASSYTITPDATPTDGNLVILVYGGTQTRTPTPPGGFTNISHSVTSGTLCVAYKFASGEPSSYTVTFSGSIVGTIQLYEVNNIDDSNPYIGALTPADGTAVTSLSCGSYNVSQPSFHISSLEMSGGAAWSPDNSFTDIVSAGQRHRSAYRIYGGPVNSETTTWAGASIDAHVGHVSFRGKRV